MTRELTLPFDGERLRTLRERAGLYQVELGKLCGVEQSRISQLETGGTKPSPPLLKKLAKALKVSVDAFAPLPAPRPQADAERDGEVSA